MLRETLENVTARDECVNAEERRAEDTRTSGAKQTKFIGLFARVLTYQGERGILDTWPTLKHTCSDAVVQSRGSIPPRGMTYSLLGLSLGWKVLFPWRALSTVQATKQEGETPGRRLASGRMYT